MSESRVIVYSSEYCGFCRAAKSLLERSGIPFEEVDLTYTPEKQMELREQTGHTTVPIIMLDGQLIGGYTELQSYVAAHGAQSLMPQESGK
jgi:glutaredoxin 3